MNIVSLCAAGRLLCYYQLINLVENEYSKLICWLLLIEAEFKVKRKNKKN